MQPTHPMAFSFALHQHLTIFEMFLSLYFRPEDFYCIHLDSKVSNDNVFQGYVLIILFVVYYQDRLTAATLGGKVNELLPNGHKL